MHRTLQMLLYQMWVQIITNMEIYFFSNPLLIYSIVWGGLKECAIPAWRRLRINKYANLCKLVEAYANSCIQVFFQTHYLFIILCGGGLKGRAIPA